MRGGICLRTQQKERITIQTGAGLKTCVLTGRSESEYEFEIEMGEADGGSGTDRKACHRAKCAEFRFRWAIRIMSCLFLRLPRTGRSRAAEIQRSPEFKQGVNVEMVVVDGKHDVRVRFFERGVGETQSSGTGSCASAVAAMAAGKAESPVRVHAPVVRRRCARKETVFLRGAARLVCRGEFFLN